MHELEQCEIETPQAKTSGFSPPRGTDESGACWCLHSVWRPNARSYGKYISGLHPTLQQLLVGSSSSRGRSTAQTRTEGWQQIVSGCDAKEIAWFT